jgi:hypothetical protein
MLEQFIAKSATDQRGKLLLVSDYLNEIKENSGKYEIFDAGINSPYSDYGSAYYNNTTYFCLGTRYRWSKKVFKWNNESFTNLYSSQISSDGSMDKPEVFNKTSTVGFMSLHLFYQRWPTMYFTRNNYLNGKAKTADVLYY